MTIRKTVLIRKETPDDYNSVYAVNKSAFEQENESRLVDQLRRSEVFIPGLSLVAELEGQIIGHILLTSLKILDKEGLTHDSISLAPMSVLPEFQNMGIGSELVKEGLKKAGELGFGSVIVIGHDKYYPRFGFEPASKWNIFCPFDVPDEVFMALELIPGALENVSGTVLYPKEFDDAL
ncbi:GNAT family N-acetyltransferase [Bacteroidota bacterium]